jgi:hypothetical protein
VTLDGSASGHAAPVVVPGGRPRLTAPALVTRSARVLAVIARAADRARIAVLSRLRPWS